MQSLIASGVDMHDHELFYFGQLGTVIHLQLLVCNGYKRNSLTGIPRPHHVYCAYTARARELLGKNPDAEVILSNLERVRQPVSRCYELSNMSKTCLHPKHKTRAPVVGPVGALGLSYNNGHCPVSSLR